MFLRFLSLIRLIIPRYFATFVRKNKDSVAEHYTLGQWGEEVAADYLRRKGYTIVERNWKSGHRDLDIIAWNEDCQSLVFVEVKTRRNRMFNDPEEAVNYRKMYHLRQAANHYIKYRRLDCDLRFDVITVVGTPETEPEIEHIEDFQW